MDAKERNEKIDLYGRGYYLLRPALAEVPREAMKFKPEPGEWSVHEVVVHLADSESNAALRARKLIVEPGGALMGYDQDTWAIELDYHSQSWEDALETVRRMNCSSASLRRCSLIQSGIPNMMSHTPSSSGSIFTRRIFRGISNKFKIT
ncbi:MAG TPA: DinB family protein [Anaerolineales bacterium]|nr:DinB family protein [Anaerolineales bacterium]